MVHGTSFSTPQGREGRYPVQEVSHIISSILEPWLDTNLEKKGKSNALYATNGDCEMSLIWFDCAVGPDIPYNQIGLGWSAITVCAPDAGGYLDTGEGWKIDIRAPDLGRRINATSASAISKRQTGDPSSVSRSMDLPNPPSIHIMLRH